MLEVKTESKTESKPVTAPANIVIDSLKYPKMCEDLEKEVNELNKDRRIPYRTVGEFIIDVLDQYFKNKAA